MTSIVAVLSDPATARICLDAAAVAAAAVPEGEVEAFVNGGRKAGHRGGVKVGHWGCG